MRDRNQWSPRQDDAIVIVPRTPWRVMRLALSYGLRLLLFSFVGAVLLSKVFASETPVQRRMLFTFLIGIVLSAAIAVLICTRLQWKQLFAIFNSGVEWRGVAVPWDNVESCNWARFPSGVLIITLRPGKFRDSLWVPPNYRNAVEEAIRRFNKWGNVDNTN